jgi:ribonuclease E
MDQLKLPDEMGLIIRTAGLGRDAEELQWDLDYLLQVWKAITEATQSRPSPFLVYQESKLMIRALRDYLRNDIGEILVDQEELYEDARQFMQQVMPQNLRKLKLYKDTVPLFSRFQIEMQIENAFDRTVRLPSGGAHRHRRHRSADLDRHQLGEGHQGRRHRGNRVQHQPRGCGRDRASVAHPRHGRLDRHRLHRHGIGQAPARGRRPPARRAEAGSRARADRPHLALSACWKCRVSACARRSAKPRRTSARAAKAMAASAGVESLSLSILRIVEEEAMKENTGQVLVQVPSQIANFLLNEKRRAIVEIEQRQEAAVIVVADDKLETPHYEVRRLRKSEVALETAPSYERITPVAPTPLPTSTQPAEPGEQPAVTRIAPAAPAPLRDEPAEPVAAAPAAKPAPIAAVAVKQPGFFRRIWDSLFGAGEPVVAAPAATNPKPGRDGQRPQHQGKPQHGQQRRDERQKGGKLQDGQHRGDRQDRGNSAQPQKDRGPQQGQGQGQQQRQDKQDRGPRNEQRPQQQKAPRPDRPEPVQGQQARPERPERGDRPQQPKPAEAPKAQSPAPAPAAAAIDEATAAAAPVIAALIASDAAATLGSEPANAANGEGKRRRGRRGGRRRRRGDREGGAELAGGLAGGGADLEDEDDHDIDGDESPEVEASVAKAAVPQVAVEPAAPVAATTQPIDNAATQILPAIHLDALPTAAAPQSDAAPAAAAIADASPAPAQESLNLQPAATEPEAPKPEPAPRAPREMPRHDIPQARPMAAAIAYALHAPSLMPDEAAAPVETGDTPVPTDAATEASPPIVVAENGEQPPAST